MQRYDEIKVIGKGSYGQALLMKDKQDNNRYVVIKKIQIPHGSKKLLQSAQQEAFFLKQLKHPNVIQIHNSFVNPPNEFCLVLEYADAKDLNNYLKSHQNLSQDRILQIFSQIILGISHIHSQNILHRDIKIANIFLFKNGLVKIGDFGISREIGPDSLATTTIGTPFFMAPEIIKREPYGFPADIWAAGCVLYELMVGTHAFNGISTNDLFENIQNQEISGIPTHHDQFLIDLLQSMLSKDPKQRPTAEKIIKMPRIQKTLKQLEKKIEQYQINISKIPNSPMKESGIMNQDDVPDWIKDNQQVALELFRQSFHKCNEDMNLFHDILRSFSKLPKKEVIFEFDQDLSVRREQLVLKAKQQLGEGNFNKLMAFTNENWMENREQITTLLGIDDFPYDEMKLIDSIRMIDRFLKR